MFFPFQRHQRNNGSASTPTHRRRSHASHASNFRAPLAVEHLEDRTLLSGSGPGLTLLSGSGPGFRMDGVNANDSAGYSMAVGDVNGDHIPDLIIGAWGANANAGKVYVVFGTPSGFPDPLPLSSLNGSNGFELDGLAGDRAGWSVAAGDVNGDGIDDIIIGAPASGSGAGKVDVVFGKGSGWSADTTLNSTFLNGTNGAEFDGTTSPLGSAGSSVAVGDVNGDGIADLIIGAPYTNFNTGAVDVVFGKSGAWSGTATTLNSTFLNGANGVQFNGPTLATRTGDSLAVGDLNHDGIADIIIGAPVSGSGAGKVDVVFGAPSLLPQTTVSTSLRSSTAIVASTAGLVIGETVAAASIPAGTTISAISGNTLTLSNKATATATNTPLHVTNATLDSTFLNGANGVEFDGLAGSQAGVSVAVGDLNGDGIADLVIGAPGANSGAGAVYVVFGGPSLLPQTTTINTTNHSSTATVASATGLVVGETVSSTNLPTGTTISAISGNKLTLSQKATATGSATLYAPVTLNSNFLNGTNGAEFDGLLNGATGSYTGQSVAVGDVNGDGIDDLIIGAYGVSNAGVGNSGAVYVVFGKSGAWSSSATTLNSTFLNGTNGIELVGSDGQGAGSCVVAGDLNGDGIADIILGAPDTNSSTGAVYVYYGKRSGWTTPVNLDGL